MGIWLSMNEAVAGVPPGARVYIGGSTSEPSALLDAVDPGLWRDVTLTGAFVPGINDRDYREVGDRTRVETAMLTGGLGGGGSVAQLPLSYTGYRQYLRRPGAIDFAFVQVAPPADGAINLGLTVDFLPTLTTTSARIMGIVNPSMPAPRNGVSLPIERFDALIEHESPLAVFESVRPSPAAAKIGHIVAGMIDDGDTLELGIGRLQAAILDALGGRSGLAYHAGMIAAPMAPLLAGDTFDRGITTGVALGDKAFYDLVARHDRIRFRDVAITHGRDSLAAVPKLVAVNSVIEVDLFGQANAETMGGWPIAGQGGLVDFVRGARASAGGRSILALPATARNGTVSRILPFLSAGTPVTVARGDADLIVTEYGIADLRHGSVEQRAERLIGISAPAFRRTLSDAWEGFHKRPTREE